jgi:hypothetical protein
MPPRSGADNSRRANLQKGKEVVSVILFRDVLHSVPSIELLHQCQKFFDDPSCLSSLYMIRSNASLDAFKHFMKILDGANIHFSPETFNNLMLLAREFGHNSLITGVKDACTYDYKNSTGPQRHNNRS